MEFKARVIGFLLLFILFLSGPGFSNGRLHVKKTGLEIYEIDYRGPETHTYIPPPNRDRDRAVARPKVHHRTSLAHHKAKRNGKKIKS